MGFWGFGCAFGRPGAPFGSLVCPRGTLGSPLGAPITSLHCTTPDHTTLHFNPVQSNTPQHTTLHYSTLHYTTLHYTHAALHYTTLYNTTQHDTTQHTTIHHPTLHYNTCDTSFLCSCFGFFFPTTGNCLGARELLFVVIVFVTAHSVCVSRPHPLALPVFACCGTLARVSLGGL